MDIPESHEFDENHSENEEFSISYFHNSDDIDYINYGDLNNLDKRRVILNKKNCIKYRNI